MHCAKGLEAISQDGGAETEPGGDKGSPGKVQVAGGQPWALSLHLRTE